MGSSEYRSERAFGLNVRPIQRPQRIVPPVYRPSKFWPEPGAAWFCWFLGAVNACLLGVIAWQLIAR